MELDYVWIKGAGDLASGVAWVLNDKGFRVIMAETANPTCVRRMVSFAEAVYEGSCMVEGKRGILAADFAEAWEITEHGDIAVLVDPEGRNVREHPPAVFVDAAIMKKNVGTHLRLAPVVIALGPGFKAGVDAHCVIETQRGPTLGQLIFSGTAAPNTGVPGEVLGYTRERVLRSPGAGIFQPRLAIGDAVEAGDIIGTVGNRPVRALISGTIRGLLRGGLLVEEGAKLGDVHPEIDPGIGWVMTDKARIVGNAVYEAILILKMGK